MPDIEPIGSWWVPCYRLRQDYKRTLSTGEEITVPEGFKTDGSTEWVVFLLFFWVPAIVMWFLGIRSDGLHRGAVVVHDYMRRGEGRKRWKRMFSDAEMRRIMIQDGVMPWRAWMRWVGVVIGGAFV